MIPPVVQPSDEHGATTIQSGVNIDVVFPSDMKLQRTLAGPAAEILHLIFAPADQSLVVGRPIPDLVLGLVARMHFRLLARHDALSIRPPPISEPDHYADTSEPCTNAAGTHRPRRLK